MAKAKDNAKRNHNYPLAKSRDVKKLKKKNTLYSITLPPPRFIAKPPLFFVGAGISFALSL